MTRNLLAMAFVLGVHWGCGDDGGDESGGEGTSAALDACHAQCESQEEVVGCEPFVDLSTCRQLCGSLVRSLEPDCRDEFTAYYTCSAEQGFTCLGALVSQDSEPCQNAMDALEDCEGPAMCVGASDAGFCPSVDCPCPGGSTPVSGFSNESGECRCFDERTCVELCD